MWKHSYTYIHAYIYVHISAFLCVLKIVSLQQLNAWHSCVMFFLTLYADGSSLSKSLQELFHLSLPPRWQNFAIWGCKSIFRYVLLFWVAYVVNVCQFCIWFWCKSIWLIICLNNRDFLIGNCFCDSWDIPFTSFTDIHTFKFFFFFCCFLFSRVHFQLIGL